MNPSEFRLLAIWQSVVEMRNVQQKMLAYRKIASQVGISERNVRENIRKLVEQGYLVATKDWYELNIDNQFIKYIVSDYELMSLKERTKRAQEKDIPQDIPQTEQPAVHFQIVPPTLEKPRAYLNSNSILKFIETFGEEAEMAMSFFEDEVSKNYLKNN